MSGFILAGVKFLIFLTVTFSLFFFIKSKSPNWVHYSSLKKNTAMQALYVIGSSRSRNGFNTKLYDSISRKTESINIAQPSQTFIFSYMQAKQVIASSSNSIVLFELTVLNSRTPQRSSKILAPQLFLSLAMDVRKLLPPSAQKNILLKFIENYATEYASTYWDIKDMRSRNNIEEYGFYADTTCYVKQIQHLTDTTIPSHKIQKGDMESLYMPFIEDLISSAKRNKISLRFYLPTVFGSEEEKKRLQSIFSLIPQDNKIVYTSTFLNKMKNNLLYSDATHLNKHGARLFTSYFYNYIEGAK
jgi:hypothetical protein